MIDKVSISELNIIKKLPNQGLSASELLEAAYQGQTVVIKAERPGTLEKTGNDDRFLQAKKLLETESPGIVKCLAWGDDNQGERFLVLEKLYPLSSIKRNIQNIANTIMLTSRQMYLHNYRWPATEKHIMQDKDGNVKLLDFNDDFGISNGFFDCTKYSSLIKTYCDRYGINNNKVIQNAINAMIKEEYQSLENVHEPIYFTPYTKYLKRSTERNNANYGNLEPANRKCKDRAKMIYNALHGHKCKTVLDIGCNLGWFDFYLNEKGFKVTGVDFDKNFWEPNRGKGWPVDTAGMIPFNKLIAEIKNVDVKFHNVNVNLDYIQQMPKYDIIIALSILHLYFSQHKVTSEYWTELFKSICGKSNKIFIFELRVQHLKNSLKIHNDNDLMAFAKRVGNFKEVTSAGTSDSKRQVIVCKK